MNPESLEKKIKKNPLSESIIMSTLRCKIARIDSRHSPYILGCIGLSSTVKAFILQKKDNKYELVINPVYPREDQQNSLIHEAAHIIYGALGPTPFHDDIENLIQQETDRFCVNNGEFIKQLYSKVVESKISLEEL